MTRSRGWFLITISGLLLLVGTVSIQAKDNLNNPEIGEEKKQEMAVMRQAKKEELAETKEEREQEREETKEARKQELEEAKEAREQERELKMQLLKEEVEQNKQEREEEREQRREEFKLQLELIKDERKQEIAERIDTRLTGLNQRRTGHYLEVLDKMRMILNKLQAKVDAAAANGADVATAQTALDAAEAAIETAEEAVVAQADNDYTAVIEGEETLRLNMGTASAKLKQDLKAVHNLLVATRQTLAQAARVVAHISSFANQGVDDDDEDDDDIDLTPTPTSDGTLVVTPTEEPDELTPTPTVILEPTPTEPAEELSPTPTEDLSPTPTTESET